MIESRRRAPSDAGIGLPELLVSMLLLAIIGTMVISAFSAFSQSFTKDRAASDSTSTASAGMNEVTRVIRSGTEIPVRTSTLNSPVFLLADDERVLMHAFLDTESIKPEPLKVEFSINAKRELVETRWAARAVGDGYWGFESAPYYSKVVARKIVTPTGGELSLFTFLTKEGGTVVTPVGGVLDPELLRSIATVQVTMKVQADETKRAAPVTLQNRVGIPNLGISRVGFE